MPYKEPVNRLWSWLVHCIGWLTAACGALTLEKVALIVGIATSVGAFFVNVYFKQRNAKFVEEIARRRLDCALCDKVRGEE